jgi:REP element-mobilizing transposase RayT
MSFLSTRIHFVWSTRQRLPHIHPEWRSRLHAYIHGILQNHKSTPLAIGGIADHIHVYCSLPATLAIADLASTMKSNSSRWVHENFTADFDWQEGYAAFTMSKSADADVIRYIETQEEHHRGRTFKEELLAFLEKFEVPYDPKYIFL